MSDKKIILPNGEVFDRDVAQDRTGLAYSSRAKPANQGLIEQYMTTPVKYLCPECNEDRFHVITDSADNSFLMALICVKPRCRSTTRPFQIQVAQLDNMLQKAMGLSIPEFRVKPWINDLED